METNLTWLQMLEDYSYKGIDFSLPGNGGKECVDFIPRNQKILETSLGLLVSGVLFFLGHKFYKPVTLPRNYEVVHKYSLFRLLLATSFAFFIGMEVCYKIATRQGVFSINPCHLISFLQIYLLIAPPTRSTTYLFRINCAFLHGPIMAFIFPVTNTLFLPCEVFTYWVEHAYLLLAQAYMLHHGGHYTVERFSDFSWGFMAYGVWGFYHFLILQPIAIVTQANLNSIICPAITDPFHGPNYRLSALCHQFVATVIAGKLCCLVGHKDSSTDAPKAMQNGNNNKKSS